MPELPEVETIARQLNRSLAGRKVAGVEVVREKSALSDLGGLRGQTISKVGRVAKQIVMEFVDWEEVLVIHLKMTGQLILVEGKTLTTESGGESRLRIVGGHPSADWVGELPSKHTRIVVELEKGARLFFNDQRVFGWWRVMGRENLEEIRKKLPPDVVDLEFTEKYLGRVLARSARAVKLVILDQAKMGGMGNIYANDALWRAGIDPRRPANKLKRGEVRKLHEAMVAVLKKGIALGGASYSNYVDTAGMGGKYQERFLTYGREGMACLREGCEGMIEKMKLGGRGTYYCSVCQK